MCKCECVCMRACVYAAAKQNNGIVAMMLLVVSAVGVGTEFRVVLVKKPRLFDGGWEVDVGRSAI